MVDNHTVTATAASAIPIHALHHQRNRREEASTAGTEGSTGEPLLVDHELHHSVGLCQLLCRRPAFRSAQWDLSSGSRGGSPAVATISDDMATPEDASRPLRPARITYATQAAPGVVNEDYVVAGPGWAVVLDGATAPAGVDS